MRRPFTARARSAHSPLSACVFVLASLLPLVTPVATVGGENATLDERPVTEEDREHWAYRPLLRPEVPDVANKDWCRTSIDRFILARLEETDLSPSEEANRTTLIRRLYLDLIGVPPTPDEVAAFVDDEDPAAYDKLVDRLLASPRYGERWAQHWLDLARFAETDGFEHDKVRKHAWKYRDWVVEALDADMPYDEFVRLQLAGDVLAPDDPSASVATAFCLSGPDMPDINSQDERKHALLNEMTASVGSALLGLQFGCAVCHDHKYDPLSQADFYRLRAFFEPAVKLKKNQSVDRLISTSTTSATSHVYLRGDWRRPGAEIEPAFPRIANPWDTPVDSEDADERRAELARWITREDHPLTSRVMVNRIWQHHFGRGLSDAPSDFGVMGFEPLHPDLLDWLAVEFVSSGWRLKPLHRLIVTSAVYRQASRPGDDGETLNRWAKAEAEDADNQLLWHFPRQRLDAEIVRDCLLQISGTLSLERGGAGVRPPLPPELVETLLKDQWQTSERTEDHYRRSIYIFARRNLRYPLFEVFDRPAANTSCARRNRSTTVRQPLLMLNSDLVVQAARRLAGVVWDEVGAEPEDQAVQAFVLTMGRRPEEDVQQELVGFLIRQRALLADEGRDVDQLATALSGGSTFDPYASAALTDLCLALFNSNEFVYVD